MKKPKFKKLLSEDEKNTESIFSLIYYFAKDWMRPNPKHPLILQIILFVVKLPVLILFLTLSPIIFIVMFLTLVIGL